MNVTEYRFAIEPFKPAVIVRGVIKENPTIIQKHAGNGNDQYKLSRKNFANDSLIQSTNRVFDEQNNE